MKKMTAVLCLFFALNAGAESQCKEGFVNLYMNGTPQAGTIYGYFGDTFVNWFVNFSKVYAQMDNEIAFLDLIPQGDNYVMTGWMWNRYFNWTSMGTTFSFWNYCY